MPFYYIYPLINEKLTLNEKNNKIRTNKIKIIPNNYT